jgi:hypothetical protein
MGGVTRRRLAPAVLVASAVAIATGTVAAPSALASLSSNTFSATGELQSGGHVATVGLVLGCDATGPFTVQVTVRQGDAVATGRQHGPCTGRAESYEVTVTTSDGQPLASGSLRSAAKPQPAGEAPSTTTEPGVAPTA